MVGEDLTFVWVTDSHVTTADGSSATNLAAAVADCNTWQPDGFLITGDIGSNTPETVVNGFDVLNTNSQPYYAAIGNHDEYEALADGIPDGNPNTAAIEAATAFNMSAPFYRSATVKNALVVMLDCNFYSDMIYATHEVGSRIGESGSVLDPVARRQLGTEQLNWLAAQLAAIGTDDFVILLMHYAPTAMIDKGDLGIVLAQGHRKIIGFYGHQHPNTTVMDFYGFKFYKCPALLESGCWTRLTITAAGDIENAEIYNYTNPGGWTIAAPFVLAA